MYPILIVWLDVLGVSKVPQDPTDHQPFFLLSLHAIRRRYLDTSVMIMNLVKVK